MWPSTSSFFQLAVALTTVLFSSNQTQSLCNSCTSESQRCVSALVAGAAGVAHEWCYTPCPPPPPSRHALPLPLWLAPGGVMGLSAAAAHGCARGQRCGRTGLRERSALQHHRAARARHVVGLPRHNTNTQSLTPRSFGTHPKSTSTHRIPRTTTAIRRPLTTETRRARFTPAWTRSFLRRQIFRRTTGWPTVSRLGPRRFA